MSTQSGNIGNENKNNSYRVEDPALNNMIKSHQRALFDLMEINSDPRLEETRANVSSIASKADTESAVFESNREFVLNSLSGKNVNTEDIKDISIEIKQSDINLLSEEWVKEWHLKKQSESKLSQADEERRNFISDSINAVTEKSTQPRIVPYRRIAFLGAAALIGAMILIGTLTPSRDTDQLFTKNYQSFPAMTSVTRGDAAGQDLYNKGIEFYKEGRYPEAVSAFRQAPKENNAALFYLGLSELATDNVDQAISALELAAEKQGTFYKETRWYLGLAWLKKGDKAEAARYFDSLSANEGIYGRRAAKILRRLK